MKKKILFKIKDEVVYEENRDINLDRLDRMKIIIAEECDCAIDDIDVVYEEVISLELSTIDVTNEGMIYWTNLYPKVLTRVEIQLQLGSDEHLDAILDGTIYDYLLIK